MLALPAPYGEDSPNGACISLLTEGPVDYDKLEVILKQFSCHPPAIPKIKSCLFYSNRYDCILAAGWFKAAKEEITAMLKEIGVVLELKRYTS